MIRSLKHIFIVLYTLQILYENKIVNQYMKYKIQTDPSIAYLLTENMYTKDLTSPQGFTRAKNAEHKC